MEKKAVALRAARGIALGHHYHGRSTDIVIIRVSSQKEGDVARAIIIV